MNNVFLRGFVVKHPLTTLWLLPRRAAVLLVRGYQQTLSPDHGPLKGLHPYGYCRHEPTCSMYAREMLEKRGFVIGSILSLGRLLTCHPWRKPSDAKIRKTLGL
jgi:putative membrane protein insertion efficiency factor